MSGRFGQYDPEKIDLWELFKATAMMQDIMMLEDDNLVISGEKWKITRVY